MARASRCLLVFLTSAYLSCGFAAHFALAADVPSVAPTLAVEFVSAPAHAVGEPGTVKQTSTAGADGLSPDEGNRCPQGECPADCCTCKKQKELKQAVARSHKPLFYNNDFRYLCDPCYDDFSPGDGLKRRAIGEHITLDVGGQYRARLHNEIGHRRLGLTGNNDDFLLHRTRVFLNAEIGERFRVFAEFIDAESNYENLRPRPIEVNRADMLNLFGELQLYDDCCGQAWARVGRQELLYGAQRTISPLDWANTRRTFEGYKAFYQGQNWDVDAFYTRPVFANATHFDSPDYDQEFMGVYSTSAL